MEESMTENDRLRQAYVEEARYQTRMIQNLRRWVKYALLISSLSLFLIVSPLQLQLWIRVIFVIVMTLSVIAAVLIGWAIHNGTANVSSLLERMNH